jgi:protein-tyrosine phosphatase
VDSCGTAAFNLGKAPDPRAIAACQNQGYDISQQRARQIEEADYRRFDYLLVMDRVNLTSVEAWAPEKFPGEIALLMQYSGPDGNSQLADPFYAEADKFDSMITSLEPAIDGLLEQLAASHAWGSGNIV